ncbi:MAG TPA: hypothetical protein VNI57_07475 [Candidatus Saccharimonadales bacterium]|nr:hypothetical protein [Candidatus Saccharimonadales bacterium]
MKKIFLAALLVAGGIAAFNYVSSGRLGTHGMAAQSPEEKQVANLESRLQEAESELSQASRSAGLAGIDTTADAEVAVRKINQVESEATALKNRVKEQALTDRLDKVVAEAERIKR